MTDNTFSKIVGSVAGFIFIVVILLGCGSLAKMFIEDAARPATTTQIEGDYSRNYYIFEVEGMPCLNIGGHGTSVTCDWSQREGAN